MSEERRELRAAVRAVLKRSAGARAHLCSGPDLVTWGTLAGEVGVAGLLAPESVGGSGASYADAAVVFEEAGRSLAPVPLMSTVALATSALLAAGEAGWALLGRIADGAIATVAVDGDVSVSYDGAAWSLTGSAGFVLDAASAELILVTAPDGVFAVDAGAARMRARALESLDLTRPLGALDFDGTPAQLVTPDPEVSAIGLDLATALWAAESVAAMQQCLDTAVEYAKTRVQFDRPIGGFQAIKHTLVEVLLEVEFARSVAANAVAAADTWLVEPGDQNRRDLASAASTAKALCGEAFMFAAEETLHVFGGIGFTWEHDAHLFYRRAKFAQLYLGTAETHRERVAELAGLGPSQ